MSYQYILITRYRTKRDKVMFRVQGKPNPLGGGLYGNFSSSVSASRRANKLSREHGGIPIIRDY